MKVLLVTLSFWFASQASYAADLVVACGDEAYEALSENDLSLAEVLVSFKLRGANNLPRQYFAESDLGTWTQDDAQLARFGFDRDQNSYSAKLNRGYDYIDVTAEECDNLDVSAAKLVLSEYVGGFAGSRDTRFENCVCDIVQR